MAAGLQLVYTAARTAQSTGYQFVAETPGVRPDERETVQAYSVPSGPVTDRCNFRRATTIYALPSGRIAISRMANVGAGYDGRPNSILTRTVVLEAADYLAFEGRMAWVRELLEPDAAARGSLPPMRLPEPATLPPVTMPSLPGWIAEPDTAAEALTALLRDRPLVLVDRSREEDPLPALEALLWLVPRTRRTAISLSTFDVQVNPERPFRLRVLPDTATSWGGEEGSVVVHVEQRETRQLPTSPYAEFAVRSVYQDGSPERVRAFYRFLQTLERPGSDVDAVYRYWERLEAPPASPAGAARAAWDLDLAEAALAVDPELALRHLQRAATALRGDPDPELAGRALFVLLPRALGSNAGERAGALARALLEPFVARKDAGALYRLLRTLPLAPGAAPDPVLAAPAELVAEALVSAALDAGAQPSAPRGRVELLDGTKKLLAAAFPGSAAAGRIPLAMAGIVPPEDAELRRWLAERLVEEAGLAVPPASADRMLSLAAQIRHELGDGLGEATVQARRIGQRLREGPSRGGERLVVAPDELLAAEGAGAKRPPVEDSPVPAAPTTPSSPPGPAAAPTSAPSLPPLVRSGLDAVAHAARHPGTDLPAVVREVAKAFREAAAASEGLLVLAELSPEGPGARGPVPVTPELRLAVDEAMLDLAGAAVGGGLRPAQALWAYHRVLRGGATSTPEAPDPIGERVATDLETLAAARVAAPPLTVWDAVVLEALPPRYLGRAPPDLAGWLEAFRAAERVAPGAPAAGAAAVLEATRAALEALAQPREGEERTPLAQRMGRMLRGSAEERALKQVDELARWIRTAAERPKG